MVATLLGVGHRWDPFQAIVYDAFRALRRMLDRFPELRAGYADCVARTAGGRQGLPDTWGPVRRLQRCADWIGWGWVPGEPLAFRAADGRVLRPLDMDEGMWLHEVREAARRAVWREVEATRRDGVGVAGGVDRRATGALLARSRARLPDLERGFLRIIVCGAVLTHERLHRPLRRVDSPHCPFCRPAGVAIDDHDVVETHVHIFWECPAWTAVRQRHPEALAVARKGADPLGRLRPPPGDGEPDWPACLQRWGVMPARLPYLEAEAAAVSPAAAMAPPPAGAAVAAGAAADSVGAAATRTADGFRVVWTDGAC
eukprot:gene4097-12258_t